MIFGKRTLRLEHSIAQFAIFVLQIKIVLNYHTDDFADRANNSYNRETMFALSNAERDMLICVDEAFQRLEKGTYGICDYCTNPIGLERLKAVPWARYCIGCQELEEKGLLD